MGKKKSQDIWEKKPTAEHYAAARVYLTLLFSDAQAAKIVRRLKAAPITRYEAKDLLRASQTYLLPEDNSQVAEELKKIKKGRKLAPVLLVRGDGQIGATLIIADGHHRICGSWYWEEDCPVACYVASPN